MAITVNLGSGTGGVGTGSLNAALTYSLGGSAEAVTYILQNVNSPCYPQEVELVNGANAITTPAKAGGVMIVPPQESTTVATLKGVGGDTGIALSKLGATVLSFNSPPPNFVLDWAGKGYNGQAVTVDPATDKVALAVHGLVAGDRVRFSGTAVPGGLTAGVWYYVLNPAAGDFEVSTTLGGAKVDITSAGTAVLVTTAQAFKLFWF